MSNQSPRNAKGASDYASQEIPQCVVGAEVVAPLNEVAKRYNKSSEIDWLSTHEVSSIGYRFM